ncbi:MAG: divergent polysaccharide deacetylase family protein [Gammaproteobacteria bacterium]|nr:divergent polysaccharide deacetylase family protein [Gammaproteobacteria bacterium]
MWIPRHGGSLFIALAFIAITPATAASPLPGEPRIAIIIDDLGYSHARGLRAIHLPGPVTLAVLPFTPHGPALAQQAAARGQDVILHQPMQSLSNHHHDPGTLTAEMPYAAFRRTLGLALDAIPQAIGVSNHTGSLLTAQAQPMSWLMNEVGTRGMFFIDSRTTAATVALDTAIAAGVPSVRRDVFLDNVIEEVAIAESFERGIAIARRNGHAGLPSKWTERRDGLLGVGLVEYRHHAGIGTDRNEPFGQRRRGGYAGDGQRKRCKSADVRCMIPPVV